MSIATTFAPRPEPLRRAPAPAARPHLRLVGAGELRERRLTRLVRAKGAQNGCIVRLRARVVRERATSDTSRALGWIERRTTPFAPRTSGG